MKEKEKIEYFMEHITDLNFYDKHHENVLFYAIRSDNKKLINKILLRGININHKNLRLETALHLASKKGDYETVQYLLKMGSNFMVKNINGKTALDYAIENNYSDIIKIINYFENLQRRERKEKDSLSGFIKNFNKSPLDEM